MRILLYNWVQCDDKNGRGGGVTVYLNNLINEIVRERRSDMEVFFLSSGTYYDIYHEEIRYEETPNQYRGTCRTFSIINSPVFSPAFLSFYYLDKVLYNEDMREIVCRFLKEYGPFDAVHFHNLEGLSLPVLDCKRNYPDTKFMYSLHNYYPFCPQVNLWREETCNCSLPDTGRECIGCLSEHVPADKLRHKMAMTYNLVKNPSERLAKAYEYCGRQLDEYYEKYEKKELAQHDRERLERLLGEYRTSFVKKLNSNMDMVFAVSGRVGEIAVRMGIERDKVKVSYIGTKAADFARNRGNCSWDGEVLSVIYMGYQRTDKGYYFLAEVLNRMPEHIAGRIDIMLAAKKNPNPRYGDVEIHKEKFHSFAAKDGYSRDEMEALLADKNLGIIPVLWEDNLPQTAIEMTAYGVPVLASDLGGASELCDSEDFVFRAGDIEDCIHKITQFVEHPEKLEGYWRHYKGLTTMKEHLAEMAEFWS